MLALGAFYAIAAFATRPITAGAAILPIGALILTLRLLLAFVPVLALLAIRPITAVVTRAAWAAGRLSGIRSGGRWRCFSVSGRCGRFGGWRGGGNLRLRPMRPPWPMRTSFGPTGRAPNLDKGRFLGGLAFDCRLHVTGRRGRTFRRVGGCGF